MKKKHLHDYTCYLFDADGTLMDTTELIVRTYQWTVNRHAGRQVSREEMIKEIGRPLSATLEDFLPGKSESEMITILKEHVAYQFSIAEKYLKIFPGVKEALSALQASGKRLAVVTSRSRQSLLPYLEALGILDCFEIYITPEATVRHKPEPEPVFLALEQLGGNQADSLFIGDSVYDMLCAENAGVAACFVGWSDTQVATLPSPPDYIIHDMRELVT